MTSATADGAVDSVPSDADRNGAAPVAPFRPRVGSARRGRSSRSSCLGLAQRLGDLGAAADVRQAGLCDGHRRDPGDAGHRHRVPQPAAVDPVQVPASGHAVPARLRRLSDPQHGLPVDDELRHRQPRHEGRRHRHDRAQLDRRQRRVAAVRPAGARRGRCSRSDRLSPHRRRWQRLPRHRRRTDSGRRGGLDRGRAAPDDRRLRGAQPRGRAGPRRGNRCVRRPDRSGRHRQPGLHGSGDRDPAAHVRPRTRRHRRRRRACLRSRGRLLRRPRTGRSDSARAGATASGSTTTSTCSPTPRFYEPMARVLAWTMFFALASVVTTFAARPAAGDGVQRHR